MLALGEQKLIWMSRLTHARQYQPLRTHRYAAKSSKVSKLYRVWKCTDIRVYVRHFGYLTVDQKFFGTETKSTVITEHKKKHAAPI